MSKKKISEPYWCDVWHGEGICAGECLTINQGKALMRKLRSEGKQEIRMYTDDGDDTGRERLYYNFDGSGKIRKETNEFNN